jgi:hypothetical protein
LVLLGAALFAISWEAAVIAGASTRPALYVPPALVTLVALLAVRRRARDLRPGVIAALAVLLYLGFFAVHQSTEWVKDPDTYVLYPRYGHALLDTGDLPRAEYPPGAILLFAAAAQLGTVHTTLPLLTLGPLVLAWFLLARASARATWLVACVALTPTIEAFWELKFDALPTAAFVFGLLAARRQSWALAGLMFGLGAAVKWWPAIALVVFAVALASEQRWRDLARMSGASLIVPILVHLPFLGDSTLGTPYHEQGVRGMTGESLPYLPLHLLGLVGRPATAWRSAGAPHWVDVACMGILAVALIAICVMAWRVPRDALLYACTAVLAFFLLNRIFSPQFVLPFATTLAAGLALAGGREDDRRYSAFPVLLIIAATANYAVWPTFSQHWIPEQWLMFGALTAATVLMLVMSRDRRADPNRRVGDQRVGVVS